MAVEFSKSVDIIENGNRDPMIDLLRINKIVDGITAMCLYSHVVYQVITNKL